MARPVATEATITPFLRGDNLSVRWSFRGLKYRTKVLGVVAPVHLMKNGYVKNTHADHIGINQKIEQAQDLLKQATAILLATGDVTEQRINREYTRLLAEAQAAGVADEAVIKRKAAKKEQVRKIDTVVLIPSLQDEIAELEAQIVAKRKAMVNMQKEHHLYQDDRLVTFLDRYLERNKTKMVADTTQRTFRAFITTVTRFDANARIQDVGEDWLTRFETWLTTTNSFRSIHHMVPNPVTGKMARGAFIRFDEGTPRLNGTVTNYITKIKTVLNYFKLRPELLPVDCILTDSHKRYSFEQPISDGNVVALEADELLQLFRFRDYQRRTHEQAMDMFLFLCATSLRVSDLKKVVPGVVQHGSILVTARKTKKHNIKAVIPINSISAYVLEKYQYDFPANCCIDDTLINERVKEVLNYQYPNHQYVFPSFQTMDTIVQYCGSEEVKTTDTRANLITSHSGRRTFINLCLDANVPLNNIMQMTGHINVTTLMVYADKRRNIKKNMVNVFGFTNYPQVPVPLQLEA
ncbi:tyrosine-type recombinase/integrase [Hymenobacter nivis]|uniref:Tyr recombinase domain-containing protein n=1 Tax=Hymenobacter nivis TaxID=1850093 RepID=A0A2Z3GJE1_9BACT|nr:tyrosine-type recombinase/integrase [Hymenobacter nivis]AWM32102.1 hypothetical protein DDQ68_04405 [Hymenobacter nivis]